MESLKVANLASPHFIQILTIHLPASNQPIEGRFPEGQKKIVQPQANIYRRVIFQCRIIIAANSLLRTGVV